MFGDCARWNVPPAPPSVHTQVASDTPVLILDGTLDAVAAPTNGALVAQSLPRATRVAFPDAAHDVVLWSTTCGLAAMRSFLDQPTTPDTGCAGDLEPAPFATQ
jgi:pimeloyl-ACP methyl ester carboxylesterase